MVPVDHELRSDTRGLYTAPALTLSAAGVDRAPDFYLKQLEYSSTESRWSRSVATTHGGLLDHLRELSEWLSDLCQWRRVEATHFVLTGEAPFIEPIAIKVGLSDFRRGAIDLEIDPVVSSQQVARVYRRLRRGILSAERTRELSEKHLQLAAFSIEHDAPNSWANRMTAWNKANPKWRYGRVTNFQRDYTNARKKLRLKPLNLNLINELLNVVSGRATVSLPADKRPVPVPTWWDKGSDTWKKAVEVSARIQSSGEKKSLPQAIRKLAPNSRCFGLFPADRYHL